VFVLPHIVTGISIDGDSFSTALLVALVFGIFMAVLKPIISLLTWPINILTLGLCGLLVNSGLFWIIPKFVSGFHVDSFVTAFIGSLIVTLTHWIFSREE
jgi:putative membrane protein